MNIPSFMDYGNFLEKVDSIPLGKKLVCKISEGQEEFWANLVKSVENVPGIQVTKLEGRYEIRKFKVI